MDGEDQVAEGPGQDPSTSAVMSELLQLQRDLVRAMTTMSQPAAVNVNVSSPPPRLGIFTGLPPTGGQEVKFAEWRERALAYQEESTDGEDIRVKRLRASLRGVALQQVKNCPNSREIVATLRKMYEVRESGEDVLVDFLSMKPHKEEGTAGFLLRLWDRLARSGKFEEREIRRKVYHALLAQLKDSQPLLALELRTNFGAPGQAEPELAEVLCQVRERENNAPQSTQKVQHQAHSSNTPTSEGAKKGEEF
ncbi:uncharacterized protein LOC112572124 [Pomacea canaliculata]|uniref:uncharacterized protein LOC112572124 n=1 Tax=Pomacea canaliculata TaxID=400727 RepID=UPI000D729381|nr:uncharacterized protein LOC112572124 [Pomacea canaliculata]